MVTDLGFMQREYKSDQFISFPQDLWGNNMDSDGENR